MESTVEDLSQPQILHSFEAKTGQEQEGTMRTVEEIDFSFFNFNFRFLDDVANSTLPASPVLSSPASSQGILFNCIFL